MVRVVVILVTLVAQVFSICAQGAFVLCVHNDGQTMIEFAWATCCSNDQSRCHCGMPIPTQPTPVECGDGCCDEPCGSNCGCSHRDACTADSNDRSDDGLITVKGKCDHCTDYPIDLSFVSVSPETRNRQIEVDRTDTYLASDLFVGAGHYLPLEQHVVLKCCGPPGEVRPPHLRTTILRC